MWLFRWLLFRLEFGAGMIKMRGDRVWRDLTALYYHHETQPMPNPLSWWFHHLPKPLHKVEVLGNHFAQLFIPFLLFAPQPVATWAAAVVLATQLWLVLSGNFAWLNTHHPGHRVLRRGRFRAGRAAPGVPDPAGTQAPPGTPAWFAVVVPGHGDAHAGAGLAAAAEPLLPEPGHERQLQPVAAGQCLRGVWQHHPRAV